MTNNYVYKRFIDPKQGPQDVVMTSKCDNKIMQYLNDGTGILKDKSGNLLRQGPISDSTFEIIKNSLEEASKDESEKLEQTSKVVREFFRQAREFN